VSGVCIDTGSIAVLWLSYLAQTSAWLKATDFTTATTRSFKHKGALFTHLTERWKDLFNAKFEILLYDLTSTYFESDPPFGEADKRKFGHSRDKRADCVQVVIALIVTPEGFPLACHSSWKEARAKALSKPK
jgi:hypothetical protein